MDVVFLVVLGVTKQALYLVPILRDALQMRLHLSEPHKPHSTLATCAISVPEKCLLEQGLLNLLHHVILFAGLLSLSPLQSQLL